MSVPDLICLGEPLVEFSELPEQELYKAGFGGDTSNTAIAAARQGARAGYLTILGQDRFGDLLVELWDREGVDRSRVRRNAQAPTGIYFVTHDAGGHHFHYYRAGSAASGMTPQDLPRDDAQLHSAEEFSARMAAGRKHRRDEQCIGEGRMTRGQRMRSGGDDPMRMKRTPMRGLFGIGL